MNAPLSNLNKAGRLIKLMGWLTLIATVGITAAILIPTLNSGNVPEKFGYVFIVVILGFLISIVYLIVGSSIKKNKKWAKITGAIITIFSLLSVPIGTILGLITLYYLYKGWHEVPQVT